MKNSRNSENRKVTAVILNYNSSGDCQKCVAYLQKQTYQNLTTIIVDNASPDPNEKVALKNIERATGVQLIFNNENRGFSAGNNVGLREAVKCDADWMIVINPDVELRDPEYVSYVMAQIEKWPDAAVVGTDTRLPSGEKQNPMREITPFEEIFWPLEMVKQKLGMWDGYRAEDKTGYCEKVSGCCFFISREYVEKANYLDETIFMYCEEPILAKSVVSNGYKELYIHEVTANHEHFNHKKPGNSASKMQTFLKSRLYYIQKYSGYNSFQIKMATFSRNLQYKLWEKQMK